MKKTKNGYTLNEPEAGAPVYQPKQKGGKTGAGKQSGTTKPGKKSGK